jgi:hypothetical protein
MWIEINCFRFTDKLLNSILKLLLALWNEINLIQHTNEIMARNSGHAPAIYLSGFSYDIYRKVYNITKLYTYKTSETNLPYALGFLILNQFLIFTFKNWKVLQFVMWNDFPSFLHVFFYFCLFHSWQTASRFWDGEMTIHTPCARDIWWTLDFASAFLSPDVNSRAELVPSPRLTPGTALRAGYLHQGKRKN